MISIYDVLKASKGIHVDDTFAYLWGKKLSNAYTVATYTGTLPATLQTVEGYLESYKIYGNTEQAGTPTPENPIVPSGCGVRTENLFDEVYPDLVAGQLVKYEALYVGEGQFTLSTNYPLVQTGIADLFFLSGNVSSGASTNTNGVWNEQSRTVASSNGYVTVGYRKYSDIHPLLTDYNVMLNLGSTALPYEPYGYKLPILSNSAAIDIYIGDKPLVKDEYVDSETKKIHKFKEVYKDTVTINGIVWDILGYDHDEVYNDKGTLAQHTVTIQTHDCVDSLQFDSREALFAFPDGLAAGSYTFTIKAHAWVSSDVDKNITFTLTRPIPEGGQLVVSQAYNASFTTGNISAYASSSTANPIETVAMGEGNTGASLGNVTNSAAGNTNAIQRALLGSNRWSTSAIRQYLNSDKAAGTFWEPQTVFDRPPSWAANTAGFLFGVDPDFVAVLGKVKKVTALNNVSDGGGSVETDEKVFLISRTEAYMGNEIAGGDGKAYAYYSNYSDLAAAGTGADTNRIKYLAGAAKYWWLRSPTVGYAYSVRIVHPSGALNLSGAASSYGVAPACCIILDDMPQNTWLQDHFLKPTDPPAPFPQIPTEAGTTVIDYNGAPKPDKVELTYKKPKGQ